MRRRALLSSLAAGAAALAGCQRAPDRTTRTTTTTTTSTTTTTTEDAPSPPELPLGGATTAVLETGDRTLSLLGGRRRLASGVTVRAWLSATATAAHPAKLTATITNDADYPTGVRLDEVPPFTETPFARPNHEVESGLYLVPTDNHEFAATVPEIARDDGFWYLDDAPGDWHPSTLTLAPGEVGVAELAVVTHYQHPGSFPTGAYEFGYGDDPLTLVAWRTSRPGPTADSRFADASPPEFENMNPAWYHDAGPETPVYLQPSAERVEAPGDVTFTLHNYLTDPLTGNRYDWGLYKQVAGAWYKIQPWVIPAPLTALPPGGTFTWTLHAFDGRPVSCGDAQSVGFLGGGRYAFQVNVHPEKRPTRAALFDLAAPAVSVTPTDGVSSSRSGDTVSVTGPGYDNENAKRAVLVVERADAADERVIPEQVMQRRNQGLRNTLPFFDSGVRRVELRTDEEVVDRAAGYDEGARRFRFEGEPFVASVASE